MNNPRLRVFTVFIAVLALAGCGKDQSTSGEPGATAAAKKVVEEKVPPYSYPAPVKGHFKDINIGDFDLVDGIAYPASTGTGTVVYLTSKPIASPLIAESACPMIEARVLTQMRNVGYLELTLDKGASKYLIAGTPFAGSSYEQASSSHRWVNRTKGGDAARVVGSFIDRGAGSYDFDLPLSQPKIGQRSNIDIEKSGARGDPTAPRPDQKAVTAAYTAVHDAAVKKNWKAMLGALGFDEKQNAAIRGLDGINADLAVYADRFLQPGTPEDFSAKPGTAYVKSAGVNSQGKKFANYYHFLPCGDHFVLVAIAENPQ